MPIGIESVRGSLGNSSSSECGSQNATWFEEGETDGRQDNPSWRLLEDNDPSLSRTALCAPPVHPVVGSLETSEALNHKNHSISGAVIL